MPLNHNFITQPHHCSVMFCFFRSSKLLNPIISTILKITFFNIRTHYLCANRSNTDTYWSNKNHHNQPKILIDSTVYVNGNPKKQSQTPICVNKIKINLQKIILNTKNSLSGTRFEPSSMLVRYLFDVPSVYSIEATSNNHRSTSEDAHTMDRSQQLQNTKKQQYSPQITLP